MLYKINELSQEIIFPHQITFTEPQSCDVRFLRQRQTETSYLSVVNKISTESCGNRRVLY